VLNVSTLLGVRESPSDALRYGMARAGETTWRSARARRPVVVWNLTRACNLACEHCYASARVRPAPDELTRDDARRFLDDLAAFEVPAVLVSGGEPLVRPDLWQLLEHGVTRGLRFTLSTNGTLIDDPTARRLHDLGITYVGISIDGRQTTHDRVRRHDGAWAASVRALGSLRDASVKRGIRFTLTPDTHEDLDAVLELALREQVERVCVYHLVPSGRGSRLTDITRAERGAALERVFTFASDHPEIELLTVDNPSDGPALYHWLRTRDAAAAARCREALEWNGGARNGPGIGLAAVDERGDVHIDQFSRHHTVGNVREVPFSILWSRTSDERLLALRGEHPLAWQCRACPDLPMCGGGSRTRAAAATGDLWGFDPSCTRPSTAAPTAGRPR